jgi:hypothetical protein
MPIFMGNPKKMGEGEKFPPKHCWISAKLPDPVSTKNVSVMVAFLRTMTSAGVVHRSACLQTSTARNLCVIYRWSLLKFRKCFQNNKNYVSVKDNLLFLDVQHYFREELGKDRPSYCQSCTGWRMKKKKSSPSSLVKWYSSFSTYVQSST